MWELACLSGDVSAIQQAVKQEKITSQSHSQQGLTPLHYAVASGNLRAVEYIENAFPELSHTAMTKSGNNTLIYAAGSGNMEIINCCIQKIKYLHTKHAFNPLHAAAYAGHIKALDYLHEKLIIPHTASDKEGMTLLHYAASGGHVNMMRHISKMLKNNTHVKNPSGSLPVHLAAEGGHLQACLIALNEYNNDPNQMVYFPQDHQRRKFNKYNAFLFAVYSGNLSLIRILFERLPDASVYEVMRKSFYIAVISGDCDVLMMLINLSYQKSIRLPNDLLHHSAYGENELMMKFLVSIGLIPLETIEGETILHYAVRGNNVAAMKYAYELGVDPKLRNAKGCDMLLLAIKQENLEAAILAVKWGCDVNHLMQPKFTLIHVAATYNNKKIMKLLINQGLNLHAINAKGNNALHLAIYNNSYEMALYLRSLGVNPLLANEEGFNALELASRVDDQGQLLSQLKASNIEALLHIIKSSTVSALKEMYEMSNSITASERQTNVNDALCIAARYGRNDMIDFLIKSGATMNATLDGLNALHYAAISGNVDVIKQLIAYGVDIQTKAFPKSPPDDRPFLAKYALEGDNILHSAVRALNIDAVKYILSLNADLAEPNSRGQTPLDIAKSLGFKGREMVLMMGPFFAYNSQNLLLLFSRTALSADHTAETTSNNCLSNPQ